MKIQRLKLVNFIGISHGLGLNEIELDFTIGNKKMIMLSGANGSGKSTIMEQLHPFKDSSTDRKNLIIDGCDGRKEIDILHNGDFYEVVHIYSKIPQSFIKKNGIELNENGGIRTCEDIIAKELGITKDYFAIGRIGSNTRNFVDFTASERKSYIGTFLNIDDILEKYKVVNEKLKVLKKENIKLADEIGKYPTAEVIETEITQITEAGKSIDSTLAGLYQQSGSLQTEIDRDSKEIGSSVLEDLQAKIQEKTKDIQDNSEIKTSIEKDISDLSEPSVKQEALQKEIGKIQTEIEVENSIKQNKILLKADLENKVSANKIKLSSFGNPEDIQNMKNSLQEYQEKRKELSEAIKTNPYGQLITTLIKNKQDPNKFLLSFTNFTDFIEKYFKELSDKIISVNKSTIQYFLDSDFEESIERQKYESRTAIEGKEKLLEESKKSIAIQTSYLSQLENLKKRPVECSIDSCPFIKTAYEHRNAPEEIEALEEKVAGLKKDLESLNTKAENLENLLSLSKHFSDELSKLPSRNNPIYNQFISEKALVDWVEGSLSDFQRERQKTISNCENAIKSITDFLSVNEKIVALEKSLTLLQDSDSSVRETFEAEIREYEEKIQTISNEIDSETTKISILIKTLEEKQELNQKFLDYIQACSKLASATTMLSGANSEFEKLSKLIKNKLECTEKLSEIKIEIEKLNTIKYEKEKKLSDLKVNLDRVKTLNERLNYITKEYIPMEAVVRSLDPNKGIPLILIKTYLDETESIANDLLDIAFNGEFKIKFLTTEKEFSIQVMSKDNVKPDIKMASQGEIAITTISISLALIEQSIGAFNILYLDEIDGPLDYNNRTNFIDILTSQINKLGIEQVFIISHNNAFDTADLGLVLLRGNKVDIENPNFMNNKTIIYQYKE